MKKIVTVVGARPQFIKAAVVSKALEDDFDEILVHTGQHHDHNMSEIFFEEMDIAKPDYNLGISGGTHGKMTGEMLIAIEGVLIKEKPEMVLLYGDTNSTLAGALAAVKLHIPVCHVEAGNRLGTLDNPEEVNRIMTDHISTILCACTESAMGFLAKEGLEERAHLVGDPMLDAFVYYSNKVKDNIPEKLVGLHDELLNLPKQFYYMTCHREENTKDIKTLKEILDAANSLDAPCIYPVHPRNQVKVMDLSTDYGNVIFCKPFGYLMSVYLTNHCRKIITDSGGLQREAFFAKKQCVTVFDHVIWPETMINNCNQLAMARCQDICEKLNAQVDFTNVKNEFGDGSASLAISNVIKDYGGQ